MRPLVNYKTLAQFRRDVIKFRQDKTIITLIEAPYMPHHKFLNLPRVISEVQSNGIYMNELDLSAIRCFMDYPKAKDFVYIDNIFEIYQDGKMILKYLIS